LRTEAATETPSRFPQRNTATATTYAEA
jgi:hypothetical protein